MNGGTREGGEGQGSTESDAPSFRLTRYFSAPPLSRLIDSTRSTVNSCDGCGAAAAAAAAGCCFVWWLASALAGATAAMGGIFATAPLFATTLASASGASTCSDPLRFSIS